MAGVVTLKLVKDTVREYDCIFYDIKDAFGKDLIYESQDAKKSTDEICADIDEQLREIDESMVTITISNKPKSTRSEGVQTGQKVFKYKVRNPHTAAAETARQPERNTSAIAGLQDQIYALQLKAVEKDFERKLEDMERKYSDQKNPLIDAFLSKLDTLLPLIMNGIGGTNKTTVGIAGHADAPPAPPTAEDEARRAAGMRIRAALSKLATVEEDVPGTIELIAKFATTKPEHYKSFKPILEQQTG